MKTNLTGPAKIAIKIILGAVPFIGFIYLILAALTGSWKPHNWNGFVQFVFSLLSFASIAFMTGLSVNDSNDA